MSQPFIGEIRLFAGNFAPTGWALCDGSVQAIAQNTTLFTLIGTTYGGDGQTTFNLPDLRGRLPIHFGSDGLGNSYVLGQNGGVEQVTLTTNQIPSHTHAPAAFSGVGNQNSPGNGVWASSSPSTKYSNVAPTLTMATGIVGMDGGSQPHDNMVPFLAINFIISLFGVFPSQN